MDNAPVIRIDREYMNNIEIEVAKDLLYWMADVINALVKAGAIYGQLVLPPQQAAAKRNGAGNASTASRY